MQGCWTLTRECERGCDCSHDIPATGGGESMDLDRPLTAERIAVAPARPVALITGASSGIGTALAEIFAQNGHEVVLLARRLPQLKAAADKIHAAGHPLP